MIFSLFIFYSSLCNFIFIVSLSIFSSPEPKARVELIVWDSNRRPSVRAYLRVLPVLHRPEVVDIGVNTI